MSASLVLANGVLISGNTKPTNKIAIAIRGDRIVAIGADDGMKDMLAVGGEIIDLNGRSISAGLVDAHLHFKSYALGLRRIDLSGTKSIDEALDIVDQANDTSNSSNWLRGRGWNQTDWQSRSFPSSDDLDRVTDLKPALLHHRSGHAAWANSQALKIAGVNSETPDPPGGQIMRRPNGEPTGILFENAIKLVSKVIPRASQNEVVAAMRDAQQRCLEVGLTGFHDFDGRSCFTALQSLYEANDLRLRVVKNILVKDLPHAIGVGLRTGFGNKWISIGGVKMFADGALGSQTARMIDPYNDQPENRGIVVTDKEEMVAIAHEASLNGLAVTVHAIGDKANHDVLDVFDSIREAAQENSKKLRHRVEHAQILHSGDFARFAKLNVIASMQPIHATSDIDMADRYWGERAANSYAWRSLSNAGALLAFGSDAPVESIDPLKGIHAAVTRQRANGYPSESGWYPEQKLTLEEAVGAYTHGPAFAAGRESMMGEIALGMLADLTIYDRDISIIQPEELLDVKIAGTIVGGKIRYRNW
jgi:predicted amidohydrolase YtcJ